MKFLSREAEDCDYYRKEIEYVLNNYERNKEEIHRIIDCIKMLGDEYVKSANQIKKLLEFTTSELRTLLTDQIENVNISWSIN